MSAGEYLPPLITELRADISDLARGFAEAKRLQAEYKRDVEDLGKSWDDSTVKADRNRQGVGDLEAAVVKAGRNMKREQDAAAASAKKFNTEAQREYRRTREEVTKASKEVAEFDRIVRANAREGESAVSVLRREYERLTSRVGFLKREMGKADSSRRGFLFGELGDAGRELGGVRAMAEKLGVELGGVAAKTFGEGFRDAVPKLGDLPGFGTAMTALIVGAVIGGTPIIGAAVATALTAGLGLGVLGLGAYILKDDKEIKKAATHLTKTTSGVFQRAAQPLKKTFVEAIVKSDKKFPELESPLTKLFTAAKPLLDPVLGGIFGAIQKAMPGVTQALANARPLFESIGEHLPHIGIAVGQFFLLITEHKEELAEFAGDFIDAVGGAIIWAGEFIGWLTKVYAKMKDWYEKGKAVFEAFKTYLNVFFPGLGKFVYNAAAAIGRWLGIGMSDGMEGQSRLVATTAGKLANKALKSTADHLGVKSPSTKYAYLGEMTALGYAGGVEKRSRDVWDSLAAMVSPGSAARATMGYDSALAMARPLPGGVVRGGYTGPRTVVVAVDGRTLAQVSVPHSQREADRNAGISGLGNRSMS